MSEALLEISSEYLSQVSKHSRSAKQLAERAFQQLSDDEFFQVLSADGNSIAIIVKHLAGNLRSRWRDFLTTDGEKLDRNRDLEFELSVEDTRDALMNYWEEGWGIFFATLSSLSAEHLLQKVTIRNERHSVLDALLRGLAHMSLHVGQMTFIAKTLKGSDWVNQSIARGESESWRPA